MRTLTLWKRLSAVLLGGAFVLAWVDAARSQVIQAVASFPGQHDGFNLIRPSSCLGTQMNGVDFLVVYPNVGGYLYTANALAVVALAGYCANGNEFYVDVAGSFWTQLYVVPRLGLP
jgi:hypothetical protein